MAYLRSVVALVVLVLGATAFAGSRTWAGPASGVWSDPNNWSPAGVPVSGDQLIFPANTVFSVTNDIDGLSLAALFGGAAGSTLGGKR